jgi:hypothetical protein
MVSFDHPSPTTTSYLSGDCGGAKNEKKGCNSLLFLFMILENQQGNFAVLADKIRGL